MSNPHRAHRLRMKARVSEHGFDSLAPHEQLELLLFFAIPQGNVNPLAHRLLDRFGSLAGICSASREQLLEVNGVGEHTALLLKLLPEFARAYLESAAAPCDCYDDVTRIGELLVRRYIGVTTETVYLLLFGGKMNLLACDRLSEGAINSANLPTRVIIERALTAHAAYTVLAHNHPGGLAIPSADDLSATRTLAAALELAGIPLLEHILVAGERYTPIMMQQNLTTPLAPAGTGGGFASRFYAKLSSFDGGYSTSPKEQRS